MSVESECLDSMNVLRVGAVEFGDLWVWDFDLNFSLPAFALVFDLHFHSIALCIFSALCTLYSVCSRSSDLCLLVHQSRIQCIV